MRPVVKQGVGAPEPEATSRRYGVTAATLNSFQSVRARKHDTSDGKPPELTIQQARDLLGSIDTSHVVSLHEPPRSGPARDPGLFLPGGGLFPIE